MPRPNASALLELMKPVTWFPPMWAFGCGAVSSGRPLSDNLPMLLAGIVLAGPLVCATSQIVNDWFDRDVDAINEPNRPIPSGRVPGHSSVIFALVWTLVSAFVAYLLGPFVLLATLAGLALAWAYSAPPIRLKQNGWLGNTACAFSYEGLSWFTGAAVMTPGGVPTPHSITLAILYSIGAHGIMTLNDFKSVEGDLRFGINSLPALHGVRNAAAIACIFMAVPQVAVVVLLTNWGRPPHAVFVGLLLMAQLLLMQRFMQAPRQNATWFSALGVTFYVAGMLVSAFAVATLTAR